MTSTPTLTGTANSTPQPVNPSARLSQSARSVPGPSNPTDSTNLKNFFQNLLNKNAPSIQTQQQSPNSSESQTSKIFKIR
jgi:hypothetical protein